MGNVCAEGGAPLKFPVYREEKKKKNEHDFSISFGFTNTTSYSIARKTTENKGSQEIYFQNANAYALQDRIKATTTAAAATTTAATTSSKII